MMNKIIEEVKDEIWILEAGIEYDLGLLEGEVCENRVIQIENELKKLYEKLAEKKALLRKYEYHKNIISNFRMTDYAKEKRNGKFRVHRVSAN